MTWADDNQVNAWSLERDETGAQGDSSVADDIDKATFDAIFSLTAEELRTLRSSSDVMARLLAAGSGTGASPVTAFVEIERRIANTPIYQLETELENAQGRVKEATERVKLFVQEDRELRELEASRTATAERVNALDGELEQLIAQRAELEAAQARINQLSAEREELDAELDGQIESRNVASAIDQRLLSLDSTGERDASEPGETQNAGAGTA